MITIQALTHARARAGQSPVSPDGHRGGNLGTDADAKRASAQIPLPIACCDDDDYTSVANKTCRYYDVNADAIGPTTKGKVIRDAVCGNV